MVQIYKCKPIKCLKMHQNLAIILWQFNYGKNSFIELVPVKDATSVTRKKSPNVYNSCQTCFHKKNDRF